MRACSGSTASRSLALPPHCGGAACPPWLDCIAPNFKLRYLKYKVAEPGYGLTMATVLFLCPNTGDRVQGWFADDGSGDSDETYEGVTCLACRQVHMVNPRTGMVLGTDEE